MTRSQRASRMAIIIAIRAKTRALDSPGDYQLQKSAQFCLECSNRLHAKIATGKGQAVAGQKEGRDGEEHPNC